jgi:hypothetical protein
MKKTVARSIKKINKTALFRALRIALALILMSAFILFAPYTAADPVTAFINYFNEFPSAKPFARAEQTLALRSGVYVASYDIRSDVIITRQNLFDEYKKHLPDYDPDADDITDEIYLFGFASRTQELVPPTYSNIVAIQGDYAIVVKPYFPQGVDTTFDDIEYKIGVVKFRGENAGDRTDFKADYAGAEFWQMRFVGDYIAVLNTKDQVKLDATTVTFYDYKSTHKLLEVFRVRADISYNFSIFDDNFVSYASNKAEFYKLNIVDGQGYLALTDTYKPFPEDADGELSTMMTTMVSYLGNNWFLRQGYIEASPDDLKPADLAGIQGKLILVDRFDSQTGETTTKYLLMRSDRYNAESKLMLSNDKLVPDMVANKYNESSTRDIADYLNNQMEMGADNRFAYYPPSMPVGALPKDGMSIVYYYYFPYDNQPERYVVSFLMMDANGNMFQPKENIFMPLLMVDGKAVQIADPDYEIAPGNALIIDKNNKVSVFKEYSYGEYGYVNIAYNNGILIVAEYNLRSSSDEMYYGAFNSEGRQITHFKYLELSLFYGDYAIGMNKVNNAYRYYRIDKNGEETILDDVLAVRNGVYITKSDGKVGLKAYDGTVLLPNEYETIDVLETFLVDGLFQKSIVTAEKGNKGYIFALEH